MGTWPFTSGDSTSKKDTASHEDERMIWGTAEAHPSLALIKYWGKRDDEANTPATGSLAVTLAQLTTRTRACWATADSVTLNGQLQPLTAFTKILTVIKKTWGWDHGLHIESVNNFPTAAGLASSSSGMAALVGAVDNLAVRHGEAGLGLSRLSELARLGSGSATRSVWGGFTRFSAGALAAESLFSETHWPEFRVLVVVVAEEAKAVSSRVGMEASRRTSPFYSAWVSTSDELLAQAETALAQRHWATLGPLVRQSYLRMFSTMFTSEPPLLYWKPQSLALILELEKARAEGFDAWETMDAGPQVKIFCPADQLDALQERLTRAVPGLRTLASGPGGGLLRGVEDTLGAKDTP